MKKRFAVLALAPLCLSASPAQQHYYWYPAASDAKPRPWALLFPRAMGIGRLVDGNQYVDMAKFLNGRGIDALVIDYDRAGKLVASGGGIGQKLAAIAADALADGRARGRMDFRCPGLAMGWSRGGEGALALASKAEGGKTGIKAAIVYYPSVGGQQRPWQQLHPVLALQGTNDSLAPHKKLESMAAGRVPKTISFEVKLFAGAKHRFDVTRPGDQSYDPGVLPKDHDPVASMTAFAEIRTFLDKHGISGASCALD